MREDAARSVVAAMTSANVRRLVLVTASGHVTDDADDLLTAKVVKPVMRRILRNPLADFTRTEVVVRGSGLDWTIMRPPRLTNGSSSTYRTSVDHTVHKGYTIFREDLADACLAAAQDPATIGHAIGVAH